jgi:hypothetical protein
MYKRDEVLALESGILFIYTYYSKIQVNLNIGLQNNTIETLILSKKSTDVTNKISVMRGILFKLAGIKSEKMIDYSEVARRLYYLGSLSRKENLHTDDKIWNHTISIIERSSFSAVFGHFISRLRKVETKFTRLSHQEVSFKNIEKVQRDLLQLGSYLQEFISYIKATKIMLNFIEKENVFKQAYCDDDFIKIRKGKPALRVVKGSKL